MISIVQWGRIVSGYFADETALFMYDENLNSLISNVVSKFNELYL